MNDGDKFTIEIEAERYERSSFYASVLYEGQISERDAVILSEGVTNRVFVKIDGENYSVDLRDIAEAIARHVLGLPDGEKVGWWMEGNYTRKLTGNEK